MNIIIARALWCAFYAIPVGIISLLSLPFSIVRKWRERSRPINYEDHWWPVIVTYYDDEAPEPDYYKGDTL